jgi:hypothetical protein
VRRSDGGLLPRALLHESWKYFLTSVLALAVDYGVLIGLTEFAHFNYLVSNAIGFCAGLVVGYALSITVVFTQRRLTSRRLEFIGFFLIGVVGLGVNELMMKLGVETFGLSYVLAKIPAAGVSFVYNFIARRLILFTVFGDRPPPAGHA